MAFLLDTFQTRAEQLDAADALAPLRQQFHIPPHDGGDSIYFCGNSLGLQPRGATAMVQEAMTDWQTLAVEGHFKAANPWFTYHKLLAPGMARIVGAHEHEVVAMNNLTTNLHLLLATFYRPNAQRYKIIMEAGAFPSDQYALESQVRWHKLDPDQAIIEIAPRPGEATLRTQDIIETITEHGDSVAVVLFGGINYLTGQVFDMEAITQAGHTVGAYVGFDLAHAAGNVELHLHDWDVDFACWCTYKYMNGGPGAVAGAYIHERYADAHELPRLAGWWGYDEPTRFLMQKGFRPSYGAAGWQLANSAVLAMAPLRASLELFDKAGMDRLVAKSRQLTAFLAEMLQALESPRLTIVTPADARGCQLSLVAETGKSLFYHLMANGVICDWREPNVIRVAPTPLYNSYADCVAFIHILQAYQPQAVAATTVEA